MHLLIERDILLQIETEVNGELPSQTASPISSYFFPRRKVHSRYFSSFFPPEMASRTSAAPIFFKCCHVDYLKDENRLEIRKGEYVGKTVTKDVFGGYSAKEDPDYDSTYVEIYSDETNLAGKSGW